MVAYYEAGKCEINVQVEEIGVVLTSEQQSEVDIMWKGIKKSNKLAFNGEVWTCRGYDTQADSLSLRACKTDYATATWSRRTGGNTRTMGTGILVFEGRNIVFARRTDKVVADPGKISMAVGGVLDLDTRIINGDFTGMVLAQMDKEFGQELKVRRRSEIVFGGLAIGDGFKAEWFGACYVNKPRINDKTESKELIFVPRVNLVSFVEENREKLELSTRMHLEHWAERIAKTERLDFLK